MSSAGSPLENLLNQILTGPNGTGGLQQVELENHDSAKTQ